MDWTVAIDRNKNALLRIVAGLFLMIGTHKQTVSRRVYWALLAGLRPVESALRRLIVIVARGMVAPEALRRVAPVVAIPKGSGGRVPCFRLFDARLRFSMLGRHAVPGAGPRIHVLGIDEWGGVRPATLPSDPIDVGRVAQRLAAVQSALDDLPRQARRLVRILAHKKSRYTKPMRPGRPPGFRARGRDEVDIVLADCHALAFYTLHPPDT